MVKQDFTYLRKSKQRLGHGAGYRYSVPSRRFDFPFLARQRRIGGLNAEKKERLTAVQVLLLDTNPKHSSLFQRRPLTLISSSPNLRFHTFLHAKSPVPGLGVDVTRLEAVDTSVSDSV